MHAKPSDTRVNEVFTRQKKLPPAKILPKLCPDAVGPYSGVIVPRRRILVIISSLNPINIQEKIYSFIEFLVGIIMGVIF